MKFVNLSVTKNPKKSVLHIFRKSPSPPSGRKRKILSGSIGEEISKSRRYSREEFQTKDNNSEVKDDNFHRQTGFRGRNETERFEPKEKNRGILDEGVDTAENAKDVFYGANDGDKRYDCLGIIKSQFEIA